jgi:hypothetical protein
VKARDPQQLAFEFYQHEIVACRETLEWLAAQVELAHRDVQTGRVPLERIREIRARLASLEGLITSG